MYKSRLDLTNTVRQETTQSGLLHSWDTCPKADTQFVTIAANLSRSPMQRLRLSRADWFG